MPVLYSKVNNTACHPASLLTAAIVAKQGVDIKTNNINPYATKGVNSSSPSLGPDVHLCVLTFSSNEAVLSSSSVA